MNSLKNKEISGTLSSGNFIMPCLSWYFSFMTTRFSWSGDKELGGLSLFWIIDFLLSALLICIITEYQRFFHWQLFFKKYSLQNSLLKSSQLENAFNQEKCYALILLSYWIRQKNIPLDREDGSEKGV